MSGARGFDFWKSITDECEYSSELFDEIIQWQLPVFNVSDEGEKRQKLRASLRIAPSDRSLAKRNFAPRKRVTEIADFFPQKEAVFQKMYDLLHDLLRPKFQKRHGKRYQVGEFIFTRKAMRVWKVMEVCYHFLLKNISMAEGNLCSILSGLLSRYFPKESHPSKAINDLEELIQCSRYSLGIRATKCATVAGPLSIQVNPKDEPVECDDGLSLPKKPQLLQNMTMTLNKDDIHCIIVVQEDDILEALTNCPTFYDVPIILITTEGIPDFTTRFFLHRLSTEFPQIPIFGLVDWSPSGLEVLCAYKYGIMGSEFERNKLACSDMEWLGVTHKDILELQEEPFEFTHLFEQLTAEDKEIVRRLRSFGGELHDDYKEELDIMAEKKYKATILSVESCCYKRESNLSAYVLSKVFTVSSNNRWFSLRCTPQSKMEY